MPLVKSQIGALGAEAVADRRAANASCWDVDVVSAYDFGSDEYRDLLSRSSATLFQTPRWLERLYAGLAPHAGAQPMILTIRSGGDGRLLALAPLAIRKYWGIRIAEFADFGVSDYCAMVVDAKALPLLRADAVLPGLMQRALCGCDLVMVRKIPERALTAFDLLGDVRSSPMALKAHAARLRAPFDIWREQAMPSGARRSLDTKRRKLSAKGSLHTEVIQDRAGVADALAQIRTFREARFRGEGMQDLLRDAAFVRFYTDVADNNAACRVYVMRANGRIVSIAYGVSHGGIFHLLLTGFDIVKFRNYSVGLLVIEDAIRDCLARGEAGFDMTIGDQRYKQMFGTVETTIGSVWRGVTPLGHALAFMLSRSPRLLAMARRLGGWRSPSDSVRGAP